MKKFFTRICEKKLLLVVAVLITIKGYSQPDYIFKNSILIAGTDRQIGATYLFSNVKPGVDGIITITDIQNILLDNIDGGSGFDEAFQPIITIPNNTKGHVQFQLDFVATGTSISTTMIEVPLTAIDIDGYTFPDDKVFELDEFLISPNYYIQYDLIGSSLNVNYAGNWIQAVNNTGLEYPGVDTVQRDVMFSMVYAGMSSISFRVGGENRSISNAQRLRSVYFKKFTFSNAILAQAAALNFTGKKDKNNIALNWRFVKNSDIKKYTLERAESGGEFLPISSAPINKSATDQTYSYVDKTPDGKTYIYRLKLTNDKNNSYYSQTILIKKLENGNSNGMIIFPTTVQNGAAINITSDIPIQTTLDVVDYSGKIVYKYSLRLTKGFNSFYLDVAGKLTKGNYLAVLHLHGQIISKKIMVL